jgi:hypothetical protein
MKNVPFPSVTRCALRLTHLLDRVMRRSSGYHEKVTRLYLQFGGNQNRFIGVLFFIQELASLTLATEAAIHPHRCETVR